jgi:hypothetical protein
VCIAANKTSEIAAGNHRDGVLWRGHGDLKRYNGQRSNL